MKRSGYALMGLLMVTSGFIGGLVSRWATPIQTAEAQANRRVEAGTFAVGNPGMRDRGLFTVTQDGTIGLPMWDQEDKLRAALEVTNDNFAQLRLGDRNNMRRVSLRVNAEGNPYFTMHDRDGKARLGMSVFNDEPDIVLLDREGRIIWSIRDELRLSASVTGDAATADDGSFRRAQLQSLWTESLQAIPGTR